MQKITLRFVVIGLIYYGFAVIEGMIMRIYEVKPFAGIEPKQVLAIMTAHPPVGIFGSTNCHAAADFHCFFLQHCNDRGVKSCAGHFHTFKIKNGRSGT
jgi:hypothetical protein